MPVEYFDEPLSVEIKDGNATLSWRDGTRFFMPIRVLRENVAKCAAALAEHDRGNVFRFPRKKPGARREGGEG
jgi:hypothetical protein